MSSYTGRHAEFYDLMYADKPYADEAFFVHQCIQRYGDGQAQRLLELACGTGSHAVELARQGYDIVATDHSEDMLNWARRKADGLTVDFRHGDMRTLDLPDAPFDAVYCLFDSIGYVATNRALEQVFAGIHRHLRPGGLFIFEFWHAGAMLRDYDPVRVRRWSLPNGELLRISETSLEVGLQLAHVRFSIYELLNDGTYTGLQETQTNRYFLVQEMAAWLSTAGFTPLKWFSGFTFDEDITGQTWHVVAVARRDSLD